MNKKPNTLATASRSRSGSRSTPVDRQAPSLRIDTADAVRLPASIGSPSSDPTEHLRIIFIDACNDGTPVSPFCTLPDRLVSKVELKSKSLLDYVLDGSSDNSSHPLDNKVAISKLLHPMSIRNINDQKSISQEDYRSPLKDAGTYEIRVETLGNTSECTTVPASPAVVSPGAVEASSGTDSKLIAVCKSGNYGLLAGDYSWLPSKGGDRKHLPTPTGVIHIVLCFAVFLMITIYEDVHTPYWLTNMCVAVAAVNYQLLYAILTAESVLDGAKATDFVTKIYRFYGLWSVLVGVYSGCALWAVTNKSKLPDYTLYVAFVASVICSLHAIYHHLRHDYNYVSGRAKL